MLSHMAVSTLRVGHGAILTVVHDEEASCTQEWNVKSEKDFTDVWLLKWGSLLEKKT